MSFKPDHAVVLELASCLQMLKPDGEAMVLWLNTLASGDYAFGYGLLRSDADAYDPFGVLVDLNGGEWAWDDQDEAWAFAGSAVTMNPVYLARWLGMQGDMVWQRTFVDAVTRLADSSDGFLPVVETLRQALEAAKAARERLGDAYRLAHTGGLMDGPHMSGAAAGQMIQRYDRKPFYSR